MIWQQAACVREIHENNAPEGALIEGDFRDIDLSGYAGSVQCVYMDPPFTTGERFTYSMRVGAEGWTTGKRTLSLPAYKDEKELESWKEMTRAALIAARGLLNDRGSLFLHVDSRTNAFARLLCDEVFGADNYVNEIVWAYQSGGRATSHFSRKHDVILFYRKSRRQYFDISAVPISREGRVNHMRRTTDENGRPCRTIHVGGKTYVYYDDAPAYPDDVWNDVSHLQQKDPQRTGYDTQKPLALLYRIIKCCTRKGDRVADLFCGSGTTLRAAADLGREFLGIDQSPAAISVCRKRLLDTRLTVECPTKTADALLDAALDPGIGFYGIRMNAFILQPGAMDGVRSTPEKLTMGKLDALDQISAGFLKEGEFHAHTSFGRQKQTPEIPQTIDLPLLRGRVALLVSDVLCRRSLWVCA